MTTSWFFGISTSIFFRLWTRAPRTEMNSCCILLAQRNDCAAVYHVISCLARLWGLPAFSELCGKDRVIIYTHPTTALGVLITRLSGTAPATHTRGLRIIALPS